MTDNIKKYFEKNKSVATLYAFSDGVTLTANKVYADRNKNRFGGSYKVVNRAEYEKPIEVKPIAAKSKTVKKAPVKRKSAKKQTVKK